MRERFTLTVTDLLDADPHLAVVLADIGVAQFRWSGAMKRHPDRLINVGIREQAMVGVAAGMALEGLRPIVHSYAPFLVERAFEQVRLDFGHQGVGALLVSVGASYDSADSGQTHHAPEDVALVATLPDWRVHVPGHPEEADALLRREARMDGCAYIRLSTAENREPVHAESGRLVCVRKGGPHAPVVVAVGPMLDRTLDASRDLDVTVLYACTVRPFDGDGLRAAIRAPEVVLVEPYLEGTSAAEAASALAGCAHRMLSIGVKKRDLRRYGTPVEHDAAHGLDVGALRARIEAFLAGD